MIGKDEMVNRVAERTKIAKPKVKAVLSAFFDEVVTAIHEGQSLKLHGFFSFYVSHLEPKECRDPRTGETIMSKPKMKLVVSKSAKVKNALEYDEDQEHLKN
jgi:DNA-binding protein HU-beta